MRVPPLRGAERVGVDRLRVLLLLTELAGRETDVCLEVEGCLDMLADLPDREVVEEEELVREIRFERLLRAGVCDASDGRDEVDGEVLEDVAVARGLGRIEKPEFVVFFLVFFVRLD